MLALIITLIGGLSFSCAATSEEEFRGVWVATVFSLHYPSKVTSNEEKLKADAVAVLDNAKAMGFNAVIFQVRPSNDALYDSKLFPWSRYLTGTEGVAPANGFDPLEFMVEEAHKRDLELHAWINPYRITAKAGEETTMSADNPAKKYPNLTVTHAKDGKMYWNPGEPQAMDYIVDGVAEIVENYDVDGVQIDDYFYPDNSFEDSATFAKYGEGFSSIGDWRRNNTRTLVKKLYDVVHRSGKDVVFGVSPIGIWANKSTNAQGSDTKGSEAYTKSYADTKAWVKDGIIDYISPQIYWNIGYTIADYSKLVDWWNDVVAGTDVKLYIGQAAYRTGNTDSTSPWYGVEEIRRQVELNRTKKNVAGYCMYAYSSFTGNPQLAALITELNKAQSTQEPTTPETPTIPEPPSQPTTPETPDQNGGGTVSTFPDLKDHWSKTFMETLAQKGILKGDDKGNALPEKQIKRADFVLMLLRMLEVEATADQSLKGQFSDVPSDMYYAKQLAKAKEMNLITGIGENMFAPESPVTRQDMFTMTYRALEQMDKVKSTADSTSIDSFKDGSQVRDYAKVPMAYFIQIKAISGMEDGTLRPEKIATRADTAAFLYQLLQKI